MNGLKLREWIVPSALAACTLASAGVGSATVVFSEDFEGGVAPAQITGGGAVEDSQFFNLHGFGEFFYRNATGAGSPGAVAPTATVLTLTGLTVGDTLDLTLDLAILDSWDGNGPSTEDRYFIRYNGSTIFNQTFVASGAIGGGETEQSYNPPAGTSLVNSVTNLWGADPNFPDRGYRLSFSGLNITSSTAVFEFVAGGPHWQGGGNESWAIDNIEVSAVPEPATAALALLGGAAMLYRRRA